VSALCLSILSFVTCPLLLLSFIFYLCSLSFFGFHLAILSSVVSVVHCQCSLLLMLLFVIVASLLLFHVFLCCPLSVLFVMNVFLFCCSFCLSFVVLSCPFLSFLFCWCSLSLFVGSAHCQCCSLLLFLSPFLSFCCQSCLLVPVLFVIGIIFVSNVVLCYQSCPLKSDASALWYQCHLFTLFVFVLHHQCCRNMHIKMNFCLKCYP